MTRPATASRTSAVLRFTASLLFLTRAVDVDPAAATAPPEVSGSGSGRTFRGRPRFLGGSSAADDELPVVVVAAPADVAAPDDELPIAALDRLDDDLPVVVAAAPGDELPVVVAAPADEELPIAGATDDAVVAARDVDGGRPR